MKRSTLIGILLLLTPVLQAQVPVDAIRAALATSRIAFNFSFLMETDLAPIKCEGDALAQGNCYRVNALGLEYYCDGTTRWTVDRESKEVYVESAAGVEEFLVNPDKYLGAMRNLDYSGLQRSTFSEDLSAFTFDTGSLDASWVVTDLR